MTWLRRNSHSRSAVFGFTVLCVLSGCDSTDLPDEPQEPKPQIEVLDGVADQVMLVGDSVRVALRPLFRRSDGGVMFFTVSSNGDNVDATVVLDTLIVRALTQGTDTVVVFAHGREVESSRIKFAIQVLCPLEIGPHEASYFPWDIGRRWTYAYTEVSQPPWEEVTETKGTVVWEIKAFAFHCQTANLRIREEFVGTRIWDPDGYRDSVDYSFNRDLLARIAEKNLEVDVVSARTHPYIGPIKWRQPASEPEVVRDTIRSCAADGCRFIVYELEREQGLKYWYYSLVGRSNRQFELVRTD